MYVETLKAQAMRLADYLATKHGVKLKSSSLLEAVAAVHGTRDWNTLVASQPSPAVPAPTAPVSFSESLFREFIALGAPSFSLSPSGIRPTSEWRVTFNGQSARASYILKKELALEMTRFLLNLGGISELEANPVGIQFGAFAYQGINGVAEGNIRVIPSIFGKSIVAELHSGSSFSERRKSLPAIAPFVSHFTSQEAKGLYIIGGITGSGAKPTAQAVASCAPMRKIAHIHDFSAKDINALKPFGFDVATGEIRTEEGTAGCLEILNSGQLVLAEVHAYDVRAAIKRLTHLGMTWQQLEQHLRGIAITANVRKSCTHCLGEGCKECGFHGTSGWHKLYEYVVLNSPEELAQLSSGDLPCISIRAQAEALVASREVPHAEFVRVFGK